MADLIVRVAGGGAEALSGCYLAVDDDLSARLAAADRVKRERLYTLRLPALDWA